MSALTGEVHVASCKDAGQASKRSPIGDSPRHERCNRYRKRVLFEVPAIRDRILAELASQSWAPIALVDVLVRDGVVELWGMITDERERKAIVVAAENAPGVKAVNDRLAWVDAISGMMLYPSSEEPALMKMS